MDSPLRILVLDDNPDDRALAIRELQREFEDVQVQQVAETRELERLLRESEYSLVITDYQLGWTDGLKILQAVKRLHPDCPVIMFTGTGSEEVAVSAMRAGLDDYVIKSPKHYVRLAAATRSVLERADERRLTRETEARYRDLFATVPIGLCQVARNGRIIAANRALAQIVGVETPEALIGEKAREFCILPEALPEQLRSPDRLPVHEFEAACRRRDGVPSWLQVSVRVVADEDGSVQHYECAVADVTDRKRAETERERMFAEVERHRRRLEALSRRLVEVQEAERRHLSRELHDEVGQSLTALRLMLDVIGGATGEAQQEKVRQAQESVANLMATVRSLSRSLRPSVLDDLGLLPALLWLTEHFSEQTGLRVSLRHAGLERRFPQELETAVYRIVQEALTNAARHSGADEVAVRVWANDVMLGAQIEDKGKGFDPEALEAHVSGGLSGMNERAGLLGGELTIEAAPGQGTCVNVQFPLPGGADQPSN